MFRKILILILVSFFSFGEVRLVAVTHASCPACQLFHKEIAPNYPTKDLQSDLPSLTIYDVSKKEDRIWVQTHISGINGLPTFVLMDGDSVKATFVGYFGVKAFYTELNDKYSRFNNGLKSSL